MWRFNGVEEPKKKVVLWVKIQVGAKEWASDWDKEQELKGEQAWGEHKKLELKEEAWVEVERWNLKYV